MNVLGPLTNPAGAKYEVLGVYGMELLEPVAHAARRLGARRVMVIHSKDGFDEISPCSPTYVYQINDDGKEYKYTINPAEFGITDASEEELKGGSGEENAQLALELLEGKGRSTLRAAVGLNTGAVLYLAGKVRTLKDGYAMALDALDSGRAKAKLEEIRAASNA